MDLTNVDMTDGKFYEENQFVLNQKNTLYLGECMV